jgi:hypothetical protein
MASGTDQRTEVVRGRLDPELAERLVSFWTSHGVLSEPDARQRLDEVVCVRFDANDRIVGVNSAYAATAPLVGRPAWIYRRFLGPEADEQADRQMLATAHAALEEEFAGRPGEPLGVCVLVADRRMIERRPEAVWPVGDDEPKPGEGFLFAGYTDRGVQVRISWFDGARI